MSRGSLCQETHLYRQLPIADSSVRNEAMNIDDWRVPWRVAVPISSLLEPLT